MNKTIDDFARSQILDGLRKLSEDRQKKFKQMYLFDNMDASIDDVVQNIPADKLDWAWTQIERTIEKFSKEGRL